MTTDWPREGRCGACGRPAREFPSGRWEHVGVPCKARSLDMWFPDDAHIQLAVRFIAEGEPLPPGPDGTWHTHVAAVDDGNIPVELSVCQGSCLESVRDHLAAEAEQREEVSRG